MLNAKYAASKHKCKYEQQCICASNAEFFSRYG